MSIKGFVALAPGDVVSRNNCCHLTKSFDKEIIIEDTERERGGELGRTERSCDRRRET